HSNPCAPEVVALRCDPAHIWAWSVSAPQKKEGNRSKLQIQSQKGRAGIVSPVMLVRLFCDVKTTSGVPIFSDSSCRCSY
ncbi:hypothetical protein STEG23_017224, partial [Scotinomys teguina]